MVDSRDEEQPSLHRRRLALLAVLLLLLAAAIVYVCRRPSDSVPTDPAPRGVYADFHGPDEFIPNQMGQPPKPAGDPPAVGRP